MTRIPPALKFIGSCLLFAGTIVAIWGWIILLDAMVGR